MATSSKVARVKALVVMVIRAISMVVMIVRRRGSIVFVLVLVMHSFFRLLCDWRVSLIAIKGFCFRFVMAMRGFTVVAVLALTMIMCRSLYIAIVRVAMVLLIITTGAYTYGE